MKKNELKTGWGIVVPEEAYIHIDKKPYIKYPGLIGLGHKTAKLLEGYLTQTAYNFIQIPSKENGNVAIITTTLGIVAKNDKEMLCSFTGTGDASPRSVGSRITPHIIRQAETRANARALRLLTDVGMTAVEELDSFKGAVDAYTQPDIDYPQTTAEQPQDTQRAPVKETKSPEKPKDKSQKRVTLEDELKKIKNDRKIPDPILINLVREVTNKALTKVDELTENDLEALLNRLKKEEKKPVKGTSAPPVAEIDTQRMELISKIKSICKEKSLKPLTVKDIALKEFKIEGEFKATDLDSEQLSKLIEILNKFY